MYWNSYLYVLLLSIFPVFFTFKNSKDSQKQPVWFGVNVSGILIAERRGSSVLVTTESLTWQNIDKISFSQHRLSIRPKTSTSTDMQRAAKNKLNYQTDSSKKYVVVITLFAYHYGIIYVFFVLTYKVA